MSGYITENENWQSEVSPQAERPRVQYIGIKGQKISLEAAVGIYKDQENRLSATTSCTYQDKSRGDKAVHKGAQV